MNVMLVMSPVEATLQAVHNMSLSAISEPPVSLQKRVTTRISGLENPVDNERGIVLCIGVPGTKKLNFFFERPVIRRCICAEVVSNVTQPSLDAFQPMSDTIPLRALQSLA